MPLQPYLKPCLPLVLALPPTLPSVYCVPTDLGCSVRVSERLPTRHSFSVLHPTPWVPGYLNCSPLNIPPSLTSVSLLPHKLPQPCTVRYPIYFCGSASRPSRPFLLSLDYCSPPSRMDHSFLLNPGSDSHTASISLSSWTVKFLKARTVPLPVVCLASSIWWP